MTYILIYLAGVVTAWFCTALINDYDPLNVEKKDGNSWTLLSWIVVAVILCGYITEKLLIPIAKAMNNLPAPTLKIFKRKK